jgi:hypothetical protein
MGHLAGNPLPESSRHLNPQGYTQVVHRECLNLMPPLEALSLTLCQVELTIEA